MLLPNSLALSKCECVSFCIRATAIINFAAAQGERRQFGENIHNSHKTAYHYTARKKFFFCFKGEKKNKREKEGGGGAPCRFLRQQTGKDKGHS